MYYTPLNYDAITWVQGHFPPAHVKAYNNATFAYWERALFQRAASVFDFKLPEEWQGSTADFFSWCLFRFGYVMIAHEEQFGTFFQPVALNGFDFYYQPVEAILSNPKLQKRYRIHEDCEILKLTPDYFGAWDIVAYYAEKLSTLDVAINTNIINSKTPYLLGAKNKNTAEALKSMMDKVNKGEPAVFYDKAILNSKPTDDTTPFQFLPIQKIKDNYVLMELLRENQTLLNAFDNEVGIPTVPYQKAERMVTAEAESKQADAVSRITVWRRSLDSSLELVRKMFPDLNLSYEMRWDEDGGSQDNPDRDDGLLSGGKRGSVQ